MGRKPSFKVIDIETPFEVVLGKERIKVKSTYIRAEIKKQNNGGARISLSQEYKEKEALIFIID